MILLTGASGFVGGSILEKIVQFSPKVIVRKLPLSVIPGVEYFSCDMNGATDYRSILHGVDVIIHAAARAHVMSETHLNTQALYDDININATVNLARQAAQRGVKRFIYISTIKVHGEENVNGLAFRYDDELAPDDCYAVSKAESEIKLQNIASAYGMEFTIIRPPLVYGPGVKANFATMMNFARKNPPLPLGAISNKRSLVAIDNLVDLIVTCINHPNAANQTFLVSDDQDVSTTELLKKMASAFGKKSRLIPVPMGLIQLIASLLGRRAVAQRLCSSLVVDISHTKETLSWKPPVTMEQQLAKIAASLS